MRRKERNNRKDRRGCTESGVNHRDHRGPRWFAVVSVAPVISVVPTSAPMSPNVLVQSARMSPDVPACPLMSPKTRWRKTNPPRESMRGSGDTRLRQVTPADAGLLQHAIWQNEPTVVWPSASPRRNDAKRTQSKPSENRVGRGQSGKCAWGGAAPVTKRTHCAQGSVAAAPPRSGSSPRRFAGRRADA